MQLKNYTRKGENFAVNLTQPDGSRFTASLAGQDTGYVFEKIDPYTVSAEKDGQRLTAHAVADRDRVYVSMGGQTFVFEKADGSKPGFSAAAGAEGGGINEISTPMPGKILKMLVKPGDSVHSQQTLFIVEAMKMENEVKSPRDGQVGEVRFQENATVSVGDVIIALEPLESDS